VYTTLFPTTTKVPNSGDQQHPLNSPVNSLSVQVIPSLEVAICPSFATTKKIPTSPLHRMFSQDLSVIVPSVHIVPSFEVITLLPVPLSATATNKPRAGDHSISFQAFSAMLKVFQVIPSQPISLILYSIR